jgi:hypothetical protein
MVQLNVYRLTFIRVTSRHANDGVECLMSIVQSEIIILLLRRCAVLPMTRCDLIRCIIVFFAW